MRPLFHAISLVLILNCPASLAWDSVGHRLSAAVALHFSTAETRDRLLAILSQHPRYREDFVDAIPAFVDQDDPEQVAQWLLGQAAYWPDIARGLPEAERRRYNRPTWHYTDGARVRGSAPYQGNVYLGIDPSADIPGPDPSGIVTENQVDNVVTALDYNTRLLADSNRPGAERAVALCWVLHLAGDIHQPLHTGSLFTTSLFESGDRGGNAIPVGESNLHTTWDRALREAGVAAHLPAIIRQVSGIDDLQIEGTESDWTAWMAESRQYLQSLVYSPAIRQAVLAAEREQRAIGPIDLEEGYRLQMQDIARARLGLAGLRLAIWFQNELP